MKARNTMKIQFLGTAAAEAVPAIFCGCDNCRKARAAGGRNYRTRSQALVNDRLLIDFPCDSLAHFNANSLDFLDISDIIITHVHGDHFYPVDLFYIRPGFSHPPKDWAGITVHGSCDIAPALSSYEKDTRGLGRFHELKPFEEYSISGMTVTPLKAWHSAPNPFIYIINDGGRTMLYAHDTDIFPDETWEYLKTAKPVFDFVTMDCTEGNLEDIGYHGHMCLGRNVKCRDMMKEYGLLAENATVVLNHFSHNGPGSNYDDFKPVAAERGFEISYDGAIFEF